MNNTSRRILLNRNSRDMARRRDMRRRKRNDYGDPYYEDEMDMRRGVKGTGKYGMGGSKYRGKDYGSQDYDDYEEDYEMDYNRGRNGRDGTNYPFRVEGEMEYDEYDYGQEKPMRLTKRDMYEWKNRMINADGSRGEHFKLEQIRRVANEMGIRFHDYDEKELCLTANMLYSDYCDVLRTVVSPDKELHIYVALAKAFLEDEDAPEGSEKLALYYYCIVDYEE